MKGKFAPRRFLTEFNCGIVESVYVELSDLWCEELPSLFNVVEASPVSADAHRSAASQVVTLGTER